MTELADATLVKVQAVDVVAIDEAMRRFRLNCGYNELRDDRRHLFLPLKRSAACVRSEGSAPWRTRRIQRWPTGLRFR